MGSLSQNRLYDPIRKAWVADRPEERVRQQLLRRMVEELGYPPSSIGVEKQIAPQRRADILCYSQGRPLLLIECKIALLTEGAMNQVMGYNAFVGAPFVGIANATAFQLMWVEGASYRFADHLPSFKELCTQLI